MNEASLSEAIHRGFLFRVLAMGGERDRTKPDTGTHKNKNRTLSVEVRSEGKVTDWRK